MFIVTQQTSNKYNKNYNYPKHYGLSYLLSNLQAKAVTDNYTTHPIERVQQEVQQVHDQTNFRNIESQVWTLLAFVETFLLTSLITDGTN